MTTENQQINNQKLIDFAQAVGADIKRLNEQLSALPQSTQITEQLTALETKIKRDLFGGDLDEAYDTFKELADKLKDLDGNIGAAITEKLTEMRREIDAIKSTSNVDYLAIYRRAKGEEA